MEITGYLAALIIGVTLGIIGGGGSILTVPVLVYFMGISPVLSTAYSLFIVGVSAAVGAVRYLKLGLIAIKVGLIFSLPSLISVYLTRLLVIPALPDHLFAIGNFSITKDVGIMIFFSLLMFGAAFSMVYSKKTNQQQEANRSKKKYNYPIIIVEGLGVGFLSGLVGAGGGFLIIPALVLFAHIPMKVAVGTSLLIIAIKSIVGFIGDLQSGQEILWSFLLIFTGFSVIGIYLGNYLSRFISSKKLKKSFGWFLLFMAIYIITKELINT